MHGDLLMQAGTKERSIFSRRAWYALQACIILGRLPEGESLLISDIATLGRLPTKFLGQILHDLRLVGILSSRQGRNGGYRLGRPADQITLGDIVEAAEGPLFELRENLGFATDDEGVVGAELAEAVRALRRALESRRLSDMVSAA